MSISVLNKLFKLSNKKIAAMDPPIIPYVVKSIFCLGIPRGSPSAERRYFFFNTSNVTVLMSIPIAAAKNPNLKS